jgi:hypothetical protein
MAVQQADAPMMLWDTAGVHSMDMVGMHAVGMALAGHARNGRCTCV